MISTQKGIELLKASQRVALKLDLLAFDNETAHPDLAAQIRVLALDLDIAADIFAFDRPLPRRQKVA